MYLHKLADSIPCFYPLLPLLVGLRRIKILTAADKIMVLLSAFGVIICWVAIFGRLKGNNLPSLHLWTLLEFSCISTFYIILFENKKLKFLIVLIAIAFLLFTIINSLYIQGLNTYNSHARGLEAVLLTSFSLLYIMYSIKTNRFFNESYSSTLYYVIAIILYFGCMQFLYLSYNYISASARSLSSFSFNVHQWLNLIFNILLALALWKRNCLEKPSNPS